MEWLGSRYAHEGLGYYYHNNEKEISTTIDGEL
jgi:hypothetical protein